MNLPQFAFLYFAFLLAPLGLEMFGFNWKSTEVGTYFLGLCVGTIFGWWFPI